jgi:hypothetical protein
MARGFEVVGGGGHGFRATRSCKTVFYFDVIERHNNVGGEGMQSKSITVGMVRHATAVGVCPDLSR